MKLSYRQCLSAALYASACCVILTACASEATVPAPKSDKVQQRSEVTVDAAIKNKDLALADERYLAYRGAHPDSSKLPGLMLRLSRAHMEIGEYLLARYYAEAYITDYPTGRRVDQAWYLRVKSLSLRFENNDSSQELADMLAQECKDFLSHFRRSSYRTEVQEILKASKERIRKRNEEIALAYEKMGKMKAAAYYRKKNASE